MAIPGVTPTSQLLSLTDQSEDGSIGAVLGRGSAAEAAYRASLSGQAAPIFGKGGVQYASFAPFNTIFSLTDEDTPTDDVTLPVTNPVNLPVVNDDDDGGSSLTNLSGQISDTASNTINTAQSLVKQPVPGDVNYGALTNLVQENIGNANIDVPGVGNVNVPNVAVNTLLDSTIDVIPGLGLVSSLINPTMVETSWGTPFNTGGGGLIGVAGQLSLNNLENIYGETQAGTEGYDFFKPGDLPGTSTPIGLSPGIFGFGTVVSGNTDMMPEQADLNNDGIISADEVKAFADPESAGAKAYQDIQDNKATANQQMLDYIASQKASGGSAYVGGSVVTDGKGNAVMSIDPATGEKVPVTSGGTFTNFGALPSDKGTSTTTEGTGNIFSDVGDFFSGIFGSEPETTETTETTGGITSEGIMDAITGGMESAAANPRPEGTFEVASSNNITSDAVTSSDSGSGGFISGGGSDGVGNFGAVGDFFGGIGDALGITNYSDPEPEPEPSSSNDDNDNDSGGGGGGGGSICFLTTAVVGMRGEADDCPTLTKLRSFRDNYMKGMQDEVEEYYAIAPKIVEAIPKSHDDWHWIGDQIDLSVMFIDSGDDDSAYETYKDMVQTLKQNWLKEA